MRYFKFGFILIFSAILAACTTTEIQTEYVVVTATPEATIRPTATPSPTRTPSPMPMTQIVIGIREIRAGVKIQADMVTTIEFPAQYAPMGAYSNVEDVIGAYAASNIVREEIIISRDIVTDPEDRAVNNLIMTIFASKDIAAGETIVGGGEMFYFAYLDERTLTQLSINLDDIYIGMDGLAILDNQALTDIQAYEPILKGMVSQ